MKKRVFLFIGVCSWLVFILDAHSQTAKGDAKAWKRFQAAGEKAFKARDSIEAEKQFTLAVAEAEKLAKGESKLRESLEDLAPLLVSHRKYEEAQRAADRLCRLYEKDLGSNHLRVGTCLLSLGQAYAYGQRLFEAERALLRAQWIINRKAEVQDPLRALVKGSLAFVHAEQGRYAEAEALYRSAIELAETPRVETKVFADGTMQRLRYTPPYEMIGGLRNDLGLLYTKQGKLAEAEESFKRSQRVFGTAGKESSGVALALSNLGNVYLKQKRFAEAEEALGRSLALREKTFGANHLIIAETLEVLATAQEQRSSELAEASRKRAHQIRSGQR